MRLVCHEGTLFKTPYLPPGDGDLRARAVRDYLVRAGYYDLPQWRREERFTGMVAAARLVYAVRRRGAIVGRQ